MFASELLGGRSKASSLKISGSYILDGYDEHLEKWLDSMRIDGATLGPVFRETKVKLTVQEPSKYNKKWSLVHKEEGEEIITTLQPHTTLMFMFSSCITPKLQARPTLITR